MTLYVLHRTQTFTRQLLFDCRFNFAPNNYSIVTLLGSGEYDQQTGDSSSS